MIITYLLNSRQLTSVLKDHLFLVTTGYRTLR